MPLLSVYNHLMQGLIMMRPNRFDTHKKSELQNVYRDIMRLTSEQPLYKVTFDASAQEYTLGIKNAAISLSSMIKELNTDDSASVFHNRVLVSSQPEVIDISVLEGSSVDDSALPLRVEVNALSSPQENHGHFVPATESALLSGQYTFTIGVEDNLYSFQFNVGNGATNLELQKKLSDFINKTAIGIKTRVVHNNEDNLSRLDLLAVTSGLKQGESVSFRPSDVRYPSDASHGIITHFGLDQVAVPAVNTSFSVNGTPMETRGHSYLFDNSIQLSIKSTTDSPVFIGKVTDEAPIVDKIRSFIRQYNSVFDFVSEKQPDNHRAKKLLYDLGATMRRYSTDLAACGILVNRVGALTLEDEKLSISAADGTLARLFSSEHEFSSAVLKRLTDISINPMDYLNKTVVTYPNPTVRKALNPYVSSIYCGLLYNNYC